MFYSSPKTSNIFSIEENIFSAQWKMISILSKFLTVLKAWKPKKKNKNSKDILCQNKEGLNLQNR